MNKYRMTTGGTTQWNDAHVYITIFFLNLGLYFLNEMILVGLINLT